MPCYVKFYVWKQSLGWRELSVFQDWESYVVGAFLVTYWMLCINQKTKYVKDEYIQHLMWWQFYWQEISCWSSGMISLSIVRSDLLSINLGTISAIRWLAQTKIKTCIIQKYKKLHCACFMTIIEVDVECHQLHVSMLVHVSI